MRKSILLFLCGTLTLCVSAANTLPAWAQTLQDSNRDIIDSIVAYPYEKAAPEYASFMIYYHQPLAHANPSGAQFPMRALLIVDNRQDPTVAVNHVYFSGYDIDTDYLDTPGENHKTGGTDCSNEITLRYGGNYIQPEHRYFAYSAPYQCWTNLDYCTADEASEDFHALFEALKKVFKGKWAMSGTSKGGITTALQHMYHPEDADIFLPYSAPFFESDRDTLMTPYWYNNGWDQELLDLFMNIRKRAILNQPTMYPIFQKMNAGTDNTPAHLDSILGLYLLNTAQFGFHEHADKDTAKIRQQIRTNDSILNILGMEYNDTVYAYMLSSNEFALNNLGPWLDTLRKYPDRQQGPQRSMQLRRFEPFGISESDWYGGSKIPTTAYHYQAKCELGYYDYRFNDITGVPAEEAAKWNTFWQSHFGCVEDFQSPYFASLTFNRSLYDRVTAATQNATKPLVFIYGQDDAWTGAAMKDEFINGTNVRKFILPAQNHMVSIVSDTDKKQCDAIRAIMDEVLGTPQGLEEATNAHTDTKVTKLFIDGQIVIIRNNEKYDITGKKL